MFSSFLAKSCLLFGLIFVCIHEIDAGFTNNGTMQSNHLNLSIGGTLDNNGQLVGRESATISCDTFSGKGLLSSPVIVLKTKIFAFTGSIECKGKCTIVTKMPFDPNIFKQMGGGEFVFVVDENLGQNASKKLLNCEDMITDEFIMEVD